MDLTPVIRFAQRHHQLITRDVAAQFGMSKRAWYSAHRSQRFEHIHPGVSRLAGAIETPEQRILAAVFACGPGAMASHRSGSHLWVPGVPPPLVDVILLGGRRGPSLPGVLVHRPKDLGDLRPAYRLNIPATNPLRVLLDYGAVDPLGVRGCLERMVIAGYVTPAAIHAALARHRGHGRAGVTALDAALADWTMNETPPDSVLEEAMNALVLRYGLPPLLFHAVLEGFEVDFWVPGTSIVIECDGWATHGLDRATFEHDRERELILIAAGYVVAHVTWRMLKRRPAVAAARIRAVVERVAPHLLPISAPGGRPSAPTVH